MNTQVAPQISDPLIGALAPVPEMSGPTPVEQHAPADVATTKAEYLADALGKSNSTERAVHIAQYLERRVEQEAARVREVTSRLERRVGDEIARTREVEKDLATAREDLAGKTVQIATVTGQRLPNLALQATSTAAGTIGGYYLQVDKAASAGWTLIVMGALVFIFASWRQLQK